MIIKVRPTAHLMVPLLIALLTGLSTVPLQAQYEQPPPDVDVIIVSPGTLPVTYEYSGRISASRSVQVRARVGGIVLERLFDEGQAVEQGDALYQLDPAIFKAEVSRSQAQLQRATAQLAQTTRAEKRFITLRKQGSISQANLDEAISARELADADVAAARAQVQSASLSLDYATVTSPAPGITELTEVAEGSLISAGDLLTTVNQLDPIRVDFAVADTQAVELRRIRTAANLDDPTQEESLVITVLFGDGTAYPFPGKIDFTGATIDRETGTRRARAVLENPDVELTPGQFVRVRLQGLTVDGATELPAAALSQGPEGTFVYAVNEESVVEALPVTVGWYTGKTIIVTDGLSDGDSIITSSLTKLRNGGIVNLAESSTTSAGGDAQ